VVSLVLPTKPHIGLHMPFCFVLMVEQMLADFYTTIVLLNYRNMLDRYVNDEFQAADKDFSSGKHSSCTAVSILLLQFVQSYDPK